MSDSSMTYFLPVAGLDALISALQSSGYKTVAPLERDGAVLWSEIASSKELPKDRRDDQQPGSYRLTDADTGYFGMNHGHQSLKSLTFKARESLVRFTRDESGIHFEPSMPQVESIAVIGARACDVAGLNMQRQVFENGAYPDLHFRQHRENLFIVTVNCIHAQPTCFCASMQTGPRARSGFDVALTPVPDGFLLECGSEAGEQLSGRLALSGTTSAQTEQADAAMAACAASQSRSLPDMQSCQTLSARQEHPHWQDVANRCLSCGNCTMVCPT
ncbi:MAG: hypothetical protein Q9M23_01160 [Mariprofundaceae bacterium]|nr:hypothetical protein [Mariprofundaceae bacterium]